MVTTKKKIGIIHFRVGRTDGVSLEIEKRKAILEKSGHEVRLISGPIQSGSDYVIDELEFDSQEMSSIRECSFKYFGRAPGSEAELKAKIESFANKIEDSFLKYHEIERFDLLLLHNIFSLAINIPGTLAFARVVESLGIPTLATHHDYFWERKEYAEPVNESIAGYLAECFPPDYPNISHVSINSLAKLELQRRRGIESAVLPDVLDFKQGQWQRDDYNYDFLASFNLGENDLIVLQATRIVERKGIEIAIKFVQELEKRKNELVGKPLYNGKILNKNSEIVLVFAGQPEIFAQEYLKKLKSEVARFGIRARWAFDRIGAFRQRNGKIYSLWDAYVFADLVTYPSLVEGWGNQFIEAVFARKPIALFEYPVFKTDIKKEGYAYVSFGDKFLQNNSVGTAQIPAQAMDKAVGDTLRILCADDTNALLRDNFKIGVKFHDYSVLESFLEQQAGIKAIHLQT